MKIKEKALDVINPILEKAVLNSDRILFFAGMAKTLVNYKFYNTPFAIVDGGLELFNRVLSSKYSSPRKWINAKEYTEIKFSFKIDNMFSSVLEKYPNKQLPSQTTYEKGKIYTLPFGSLVIVRTDYICSFFYKHTETTKEEIFKFLSEEKLKELNSKSLTIANTSENTAQSKLTLIPNPIIELNSKLAEDFTITIQKYLEKGMHRSILFYGNPGTGKTSLAYALVKKLDFVSLKCSVTSQNIDMLKFLIETLGIEAVILDDFDHNKTADTTLDFLEFLKKHCKLVIGLVNSMTGFHVAVLRPGRFDEIHEVNSLDEKVVKGVLGDMAEKYYDKVKTFPIAFVNEFYCRSRIIPEDKLDDVIKELNSRINGSLYKFDSMKEMKKSSKKKVPNKNWSNKNDDEIEISPEFLDEVVSENIEKRFKKTIVNSED